MEPSTSNVRSAEQNVNGAYYPQQLNYSMLPAAPGPSGSHYDYSQASWPGTGAYSYPYAPEGSSYPTDGRTQIGGYSQPGTWSIQSQPFLRPASNLPRPTPSPPPPSDVPKEWDLVLRRFLISAGLIQALRGFELDMLVLNEEREKRVLPTALDKLREGLAHIRDLVPVSTETEAQSLDERKLDYVRLADKSQPTTPTSLTRSISAFLAQNRARNDESNRKEFLLSLEERRRQVPVQDDSVGVVETSCARLDARSLDRDSHMKYDIAQNDEGPLKKTVRSTTESPSSSDTPPIVAAYPTDVPTAKRHPGIDERLKNVEQHLAVRYVPAPPASLLDRLRHLEDHIIRLEKDYPPWAALHFNQPRRGWPAPPRQTPIIVDNRTTINTLPEDSPSMGAEPKVEGSKKGKGKVSSLHRAVMEKLEVQKVKEELGNNSSFSESRSMP